MTRAGLVGTRIDARFARLRAEGRKALIPYVVAGDPSAALTVDLMHGLARAGADVIELGVPFSDPSADGPVIQRATERAIANGVGLAATLDCVRAFRRVDEATPVVLMGYANPFERMAADRGGLAGLAAGLADAGVDGLLVVDYPPEECVDFAAAMTAAGIANVYLLAPTTSDARIATIARAASGYVYYVSLKGITGAKTLDVAAVGERIPLIRRHTDIPIGVGFGIRDPETAAAVARVADAVVVGTRLVETIAAAGDDGAVEAAVAFVASLRAALDGVAAAATEPIEDRRTA